jgi:hypothetical protein
MVDARPWRLYKETVRASRFTQYCTIGHIGNGKGPELSAVVRRGKPADISFAALHSSKAL